VVGLLGVEGRVGKLLSGRLTGVLYAGLLIPHIRGQHIPSLVRSMVTGRRTPAAR
jgi:hypothetical protein